ncbi:putative disease resistance protein RGA3 [Bienertia sinuspersici]
MDVAVVLTLVQTLLQLLDSPISREIQSLWGYRSQLHKLRHTMSTIQTVLNSVEQRERLRLPITIPPVTLDRIKEAVYDADDLFDEVATVSHLKKLVPGNKLSKEVRLFFSRFNQLHYALSKSREIRKVREILDDIAKDHRDFGGLYQPPNNVEVTNINLSRETHSFLCPKDLIIGRDEDKEVVIDMLLNTSTVDNVIVVSIVGMGGLGKTALAQLVYNDDRIQREFSPKMWVCVSDDVDLNVKELVCKILVAASGKNDYSDLDFEQLQSKFRQQLNGKKYLLVLDDVWNENSNKWNDMRNLLFIGGRGSRVVVTTRSKRVANAVESNQHTTHELKGLSDDKSWSLFEKMTLKPGQVQMESHLVEIGKEIVCKCFNVPLAIRVMAGLLQGQGESTWRNLKNTDMANIKKDDRDGIIPMLKISYNHLLPHLKSCFSYCAVFPKDYKFKKEDLICHWVAQGFIMPINGQSLEDLGDECFMKLLQRCFFQDVEQDEVTGVILSCKMHDLFHDLAKGILGKEIYSPGNDIHSFHDDKTRHVFVDDTFVKIKDVECYLTKMKRVRTYVAQRYDVTYNGRISFGMRYLRVLDLSGVNDISTRNMKLASMMGELLHLRYLDLSGNSVLFALPDSITQLYNLQTLKLKGRDFLQELPRELSKLVNLRHLDIQGCSSLKYMPRGMNSMTSLHKITNFVVGDKNNGGSSEAGEVGKLEDLKYLNSLRDCITIEMKDGWTYSAGKVEGKYLINKPLLNDIRICWDRVIPKYVEDAKALLQGLQPHPNIKILSLYGYPGVGFPSWGWQSSMNLNMNATLPNLVSLSLSRCSRLEHLPVLSQLHKLKVLQLNELAQLEYIESERMSGDESIFFPSLTTLELLHLPNLKGWCWKRSVSCPKSEATSTAKESEMRINNRDQRKNNNKEQQQEEEEEDISSLIFPCLTNLHMSNCVRLRIIPGFPKLEEMRMSSSNMLLEHLHSLHMEAFQQLSHLEIKDECKLVELATKKVFQSGQLSSLRSLTIEECWKLKSISGQSVWENFTALETLTLRDLPRLQLEDEERSNGDDADMHMPWQCLAPTLCHLTLRRIPNMEKLPKGIQYLTALRSLTVSYLIEIPAWIQCLTSLQFFQIGYCKRLELLPEEMRHLPCLTHLELIECSPELEERCKEFTGIDWPKIQHIPFFFCGSADDYGLRVINRRGFN